MYVGNRVRYQKIGVKCALCHNTEVKRIKGTVLSIEKLDCMVSRVNCWNSM